MKNEAAQAKSEGQHIHGAFHTRQVHTSCKWGHTKMAHNPLQTPDHSIGESYAKMKAEPCKIVKNTREDSRTQKKMKNEAAKAKSKGQHIHGAFHTRQAHTSCKWQHTKIGTHPLQTIQDPRKTMKNEAAQAKSEGQHIHGAVHTRQVHTSCKWGHTKMAQTPLQTIQSGKTMQK